MRNSIIQFEILNILHDFKRHTISQIAGELGVSVSTVQRHLTELELKYPISITVGGRNSGGVRLLRAAIIGNKFVNNVELKLIISALAAIENQQPQAKELIKKLTLNEQSNERIV